MAGIHNVYNILSRGLKHGAQDFKFMLGAADATKLTDATRFTYKSGQHLIAYDTDLGDINSLIGDIRSQARAYAKNPDKYQFKDQIKNAAVPQNNNRVWQDMQEVLVDNGATQYHDYREIIRSHLADKYDKAIHDENGNITRPGSTRPLGILAPRWERPIENPSPFDVFMETQRKAGVKPKLPDNPFTNLAEEAESAKEAPADSKKKGFGKRTMNFMHQHPTATKIGAGVLGTATLGGIIMSCFDGGEKQNSELYNPYQQNY